MQPWDTLTSLAGDLIVLAAAVIDLAATRVRVRENRRRPTGDGRSRKR